MSRNGKIDHSCSPCRSERPRERVASGSVDSEDDGALFGRDDRAAHPQRVRDRCLEKEGVHDPQDLDSLPSTQVATGCPWPFGSMAEVLRFAPRRTSPARAFGRVLRAGIHPSLRRRLRGPASQNTERKGEEIRHDASVVLSLIR